MKRLFLLALLLAPFFNAQAQEPEFDIVWTGTRSSGKTNDNLYPVFLLKVWAKSGDTRQGLANTYAAGDLELLGHAENPDVLLVREQVFITALPRDMAEWRDSHPAVFQQWEAAAIRADAHPQANASYYQLYSYMGMLERWEQCYKIAAR